MITDGTSLTAEERQLLARAAELLHQRFAADLHAVWLFGSRARGETPSNGDADVDVLALVNDASWDGKREVRRAFRDAARELASERVAIKFSVHVHTPEWLADQRAIKSFFIGEIDRDKVLIEGTA